MADLSSQRPPPPESAGGFQVVMTPTGALELTWPPSEASELHVWILLADPRTVDPNALHPERLLQNLIRVPVEPARGHTTVYVPSLRTLGVTLVLRGPDGAPLETPPFTVSPRSPAPTPPSTPAPTPTSPPQTTSERQRIPLVFAKAGSGPPGLRGAAPGRTDEPADFDALRARVAALAALAPRPQAPANTDTQTGFGVRQRFTLTRLAFPAKTLGERRHLVAQTTFIGRSDLESWRREPPSWSFPVPPEADGVVDGLAVDDQVVFYALLVERDGVWLPAPLTPSSPPFDDITRPFVLGDARRRLEDALAASTSDALRELIAEALAPLCAPGAPP